MIVNHTIYFEQDARVPITSFNLVFTGGGEQQEREERSGLSRIAAKLLFRGTHSLSREEIQRKFDLLGAEVFATVTQTDFTVTVQALTKNIQEVVSLVFHCIQHASFPETELKIAKQQHKASLLSSLQDPETVLRVAHKYILYEGKRFGKLGSLAALEQLTRNEIELHFDKIRSAAVCYCSGTSDISKNEFEALLTPFFQQRTNSGYELLPEVEFKNCKSPEAHIVHLEHASNDRLMWSHQGLSATDPQRFALSLIIDALGSFEGFLFDQLRNKNGWCYGAYATIIPGTTRLGRVSYYADPSDKSSQFLFPQLLHHIATFHNEAEFVSRLSERPSTFKNRYVYQMDRNYKILSQINFDRFGIPKLSKEEYYNEIDSLTPEKFSQVIGAIFNAQKLIMVFYGDANRIQKILHSINPALTATVYNKNIIIE